MEPIYLYLIIFIIIIVCFYIYINRNICSGAPESFVYDTNIKGSSITIIGTTHGNEQVGYYAIKELINRINSKKIILKKGILYLIPVVNYCGFKMNTRNGLFFYDINRNYTTTSDNPINKTVLNFANKSDFTLDFHEGWGYHSISDSIGSTITPSKTNISNEIAQSMMDNVNLTISNSKKKFIIRTDDAVLLKKSNYKKKTDIDGTLSTYMNSKNKDYILIEITGQSLIQSMDLRVEQAMIFIKTVLSYYNLI
jgi:predicted deacylase